MAYKVSNKYLFYLELAYGWLLVSFLYLWITDVPANIHAVLLLTAFTPALITHAFISMISNARATNRKFFFFSLMWGVKFFFFLITEGLYFFFQQTILLLDLIDIFLMLVIAFLTFLSLVYKNPFFYARIEDRTIMFVGLAGVFVTIFIAILIGLSFFDFFWEPIIHRVTRTE